MHGSLPLDACSLARAEELDSHGRQCGTDADGHSGRSAANRTRRYETNENNDSRSERKGNRHREARACARVSVSPDLFSCVRPLCVVLIRIPLSNTADDPPATRRSYGRPQPISAASVWTNVLNRDLALIGGESDYDAIEPDRFLAEYTIANMHANQQSANPFLDAFLRAYNDHETVSVAPDDIWLVIQLQLSAFLQSENGTSARSRFFVDGDAHKEIILLEPAGRREQDWSVFLFDMSDQVRRQLKSDVADLSADFTTSHQIESLLSAAVLIDTFQPLFTYHRVLPSSGLRNVLMIGEDDDWVRLGDKVARLKQVMRGTKFASNYLAHLEPIMDQLLLTYRRRPDALFWSRIFRDSGTGSDRHRDGDGDGDALDSGRISGWFLRFFGLDPKKSVAVRDVRLRAIRVPVSVANHALGLSVSCYVVGGFHGVRYEPAIRSYRPAMSISVQVDRRSTKPIKPSERTRRPEETRGRVITTREKLKPSQRTEFDAAIQPPTTGSRMHKTEL